MRFRSGLASIAWLRRSTSLYPLFHKDVSLYTLYEDRYSDRLRQNVFGLHRTSPWTSGFDRFRPWNNIYIQVLEGPRTNDGHKAKVIYGVSSSNGRTDGTHESNS
jgi:hypothetical protein